MTFVEKIHAVDIIMPEATYSPFFDCFLSHWQPPHCLHSPQRGHFDFQGCSSIPNSCIDLKSFRQFEILRRLSSSKVEVVESRSSGHLVLLPAVVSIVPPAMLEAIHSQGIRFVSQSRRHLQCRSESVVPPAALVSGKIDAISPAFDLTFFARSL